MVAANTVILLLHPITAASILGWMWWQYGWKKKSRELKGKSRQEDASGSKGARVSGAYGKASSASSSGYWRATAAWLIGGATAAVVRTVEAAKISEMGAWRD